MKQYFERNVQSLIDKHLYDDYIIIVTGSRQSGKTTLLKHYFNKLSAKKNPCFFINLEDIDYLSLLNESPKNIFNFVKLQSDKKIYLFIDEIQYLHNPTNFLKFLYDEYKEKIKLIVSGSSAFYIDSKFKDSLAGRKRICPLTTLTLNEFLRFKNADDLSDKFQKLTLNNFSIENFNIIEKRNYEIFLNEYIVYGGYPRVVVTNDNNEKIEVISELANSYVKKDALESNITYTDKFFKLFRILSSRIGQLLNKNELSNLLNLSSTAIDNYLTIMLKSFHIYFLPPFYSNMTKELKKMNKIYFMDLGLRNYFFRNFKLPFERNDIGHLYENFIFLELLNRSKFEDIRFWRTQNGNEVDFIAENRYAFEVKYNLTQFNYSKYKLFLETYPDINFNVVYNKTNKDNLKKLYKNVTQI